MASAAGASGATTALEALAELAILIDFAPQGLGIWGEGQKHSLFEDSIQKSTQFAGVQVVFWPKLRYFWLVFLAEVARLSKVSLPWNSAKSVRFCAISPTQNTRLFESFLAEKIRLSEFALAKKIRLFGKNSGKKKRLFRENFGKKKRLF